MFRFLFCQSSLVQPQMMVVPDLDDLFVPLPDDLLVNLSESRNVVDAFLDSLPSMFQDNVNVESAFGPALKAVFMVMVCGSVLHSFFQHLFFLLLPLPIAQLYQKFKIHQPSDEFMLFVVLFCKSSLAE